MRCSHSEISAASSNSPPPPPPPPPPGSRFHQLLKRCTSLSHLKQIHSQLITRPTRATTAVLWNILLRAYSNFPAAGNSLRLFGWLLAAEDGGVPDKYTYTFAIGSCSRATSPELGEAVHGMTVKTGFLSDIYVGNALVNMYSAFWRIDDSKKVFDEMPLRDVVTWTSLVGGYAKAGKMENAQEMFDEMPDRNEVSWAVMIAGYAGIGRHSDAVRCFHDMLWRAESEPNEAAIVSVLSACAHVGALDQGKWIHTYIDKNSIPHSSKIATALINMYSKCGRIDCAKQVFDAISIKDDVLMWTSMISGLAMHGRGREALEAFHRMVDEGLKPDKITLLGVLNGCSHSGLVDEGGSIFHDMKNSWDVVPEIEHYGCLIDLLGRAGRLERAIEVVKTMPVKPDIAIWRALLSACRKHSNVQLGEHIVEMISQLHSGDEAGGGYVLLSNIYAAIGQWDGVRSVRKKVSLSSPGCSWIEINGEVHEFFAADKLHPRILEIRWELQEVLRRARVEGGYVVSARNALFDLSEEEKEEAVAWHSEKLALTFGLMSTGHGCLIRIVKNLRICEDCHSAMKAVSRVFGREIVVRDRSRFHTFLAGDCSCVDYW